MISYDISDIIDVIGYVSNRDVSDIIDVMGTCSRVFQGTRWHVMWYHMISVISYDISDIIWLSCYLGGMCSNPNYINDITDITDVIGYHMISVISYAIIWYHHILTAATAVPHILFLTYHMISYDIIWYHITSMISVIS